MPQVPQWHDAPALRIALQLKVWTKDVDRLRNEQLRHFERKAREITQTESLTKTNAELRKQVSELQDQLARPAAEHHVANGSRSIVKLRPKNFACWGCGSPDHPIRSCPNKTPEERRHNDSWKVRHEREKRTRNCTRSRYKKRRSGNRHGNADGLSRRPDATKPYSESLPKVNAIDRINEDSSSEGVETSSVRESLIERQRSDTELSRIVQLRLTYTERPKNEDIDGESELTKKLCNN